MDVFFTLFQISFSFFLDALMKVRLPLPLLAALAAAFPAATAAPADTELGNVMFVGDSITHGVNSASYRWALHKIFTDNGISYRAEGVKTGNYSGGVTAGTSYGGQIFNNEHSSQASARAWEISGRSNGSRFDGSNIYNWLGISGTKANGSAYSGQTFTGDNTPDTFFMMIGTNDLLSDGNNATLANRLDSVSQNLLNDMDTIVEAMFQANEHANVIILTIPCWTRHSNGNSDATHQAVADYNDRLKTWGNGRQNVTVIDVNAGIIDVTSSTPVLRRKLHVQQPRQRRPPSQCPGRSAYGRQYRQGHGLRGAHRRTGKKSSWRPGHQFSPGRAIPRMELEQPVGK